MKPVLQLRSIQRSEIDIVSQDVKTIEKELHATRLSLQKNILSEKELELLEITLEDLKQQLIESEQAARKYKERTVCKKINQLFNFQNYLHTECNDSIKKLQVSKALARFPEFFIPFTPYGATRLNSKL